MINFRASKIIKIYSGSKITCTIFLIKRGSFIPTNSMMPFIRKISLQESFFEYFIFNETPASWFLIMKSWLETLSYVFFLFYFILRIFCIMIFMKNYIARTTVHGLNLNINVWILYTLCVCIICYNFYLFSDRDIVVLTKICFNF